MPQATEGKSVPSICVCTPHDVASACADCTRPGIRASPALASIAWRTVGLTGRFEPSGALDRIEDLGPVASANGVQHSAGPAVEAAEGVAPALVVGGVDVQGIAVGQAGTHGRARCPARFGTLDDAASLLHEQVEQWDLCKSRFRS